MKRLFVLLTIFVIFALVLVACGADEEETPTPEPEVEEEAPPPEEEEEEAPPPVEEEEMEEEEEAMPEGEGTYLDRAYAGEFAGTEVLIQTVMVDAEDVIFNEGMESFEEATGIDVVHVGTKEHETQIIVQVESGNAPDIAMFSQPALLQSFVNDGNVMDVREFIPEEDLQERYAQGWLDSATFVTPDGEEIMGGVWWKAANKDLVWYNKKAFEAAGYEIPTTWDELLALTQQIADDGDPAWCIGIGSGVATGWVATDWVEALVLRTTSPENYDAWVAGDLPFDSPEVKHAVELMSEIWLNPDYVLGGTDQIITEQTTDSPGHMFEDPPACWLHRQASWIQGFFGEGLEAGVDWDFFYLPGVDPAYGEPVLMAGDIMTMFNDRPEVRATMEYLSSGASIETVVRNGRGMSPHADSSTDWYANDIDRAIAELLLGAEVVRFDGGDVMPPEVGAGSFWSGMVDYVSGAVDLDTAMQEIDAAWPTGEEGVVIEEPEEEVTDEPGEEEAELGDPLKIGVLSDLSGGLALFGNEMWEGLQLGFQYATDGSMVAGNRPVELIIRDDTSDVDAGTSAARELIESEGVEVLIGNSSSAVALQVQQIADEYEVVYFAAPAASADITGANWNPHTFRVCRNSAQDGLTMAAWSVNNLGENYLILAEDYAFGQATAAGFQAAFGANGANFLTEEPIYAPSDTTDFTPYIQQILDLDPDGLILIWATNTSGVVMYEQLDSQGVTAEIPFITGFSSNDLVALSPPGTVGATGLIVYHYTLPDTPANDWMTEQYNEQFGGNPDLFSECGFATAQAVVAALDATDGATDSETLISALEGLEFEGPKGTYVIRPEDHQALASMYIVELISIDDPEQAFFAPVAEISGAESAPPCTAPGRCE